MPTATAHNRSSTTSSTQNNTEIAQRVRRALAFALPVSVLIGVIMGLLQINPGFLLSWLAPEVQPLDITRTGMALMGLTCGLIAGLHLRDTSFLLRLAVTLLAILVGWIGAVLTQGIALGVFLNNALITPSQTLTMDQFGLGILGAVLGIAVAQRIRVQSEPSAATRRTGTSRRRTRRPSRSSELAERITTGRTTGAGSHDVEVTTPARSNGRVKLPRASQHQNGRRQSRGRRRSVSLGKEVIDICPYCLEEVKRHDQRGRVVCKICRTAHHADCWAIAGRCQVPHLQA